MPLHSDRLMSHVDSDNPFASPLEQAQPVSGYETEEESVRRQYLNHEASIRSVGLLFIIFGILGCVGAAFYLLPAIAIFFVAEPLEALAVVAIVCAFAIPIGALSAFQLWTGVKLRQLKPVARIPAIVLSAIGLLAIPIGTLISAYFLWLVASDKGGYVLSEQYADIRRATPHIKYKTSLIVWILLGLVLLLLVVGCLGSLVTSIG